MSEQKDKFKILEKFSPDFKEKLSEMIRKEIAQGFLENNVEMLENMRMDMISEISNHLKFEFLVSEENYDGIITIEPIMSFKHHCIDNVHGKLQISIEVETDESKRLTHHKLKIIRI